jgi:proteasome lid subunit RPN8/RPN11
MAFSLQTVLHAARGKPPRLVCAPQVWHRGVDELRRRADGRRESGAFLLGKVEGRVRRIEEFLFYDDIDPTCFARGIVEFDGRKLGAVWQRCRDSGRTVVADVHVHPGHYGQSPSDQRNPIIAEAGHLAVIIPNYARGARLPRQLGIYEYLGSYRWRDLSAAHRIVLYVGWLPSWLTR